MVGGFQVVCQMVPESARGYQRVPDGASGCQMVPEGARGCQRGQIGTVVARGLGKASELIFVKVSIAGVEVDALVDTGATTSCCRWDWYQEWKDHLGALIKSKVRIIGVGHDPIKVKGLTKPLTLQWDGVGGQFQLMVLTALTDVDVVLGKDVLRQLDVKINFKNQVASPAREPCNPLKPTKTVGLLLNNPTFTCKGKIPVKKEEVEEIAKGVLRQGHREVHSVWMASDRRIKTKDKIKNRRIVRESSMPWNQAGNKAKLQEDLKDIRQKLSRVLSKDLDKSDSSFVEASSQVKCIEGSVLVDLCMQRSGKRGSGCDAPKSADRIPKASEGFPTPVTSPPRPPTPPAAQVRPYSRCKYDRREVCFSIRILKPSKTEKKEEKLKGKHLKDVVFKASHPNRERTLTSLLHSRPKSERGSREFSVMREYRRSDIKPVDHVSRHTNDLYSLKLSKTSKEEAEVKSRHFEKSMNCDVTVSDVIVTEVNGDITRRDINKPIARKRYAQKHSFVSKKGFIKSSLRE